VNQLIQDCAGLYLRATASEYMASPGQPIRLTMELINRSPVSIEIKNLKSESLALDSSLSLTLKNNDPITIKSVKNYCKGSIIFITLLVNGTSHSWVIYS
jgi:hypothetical protein